MNRLPAFATIVATVIAATMFAAGQVGAQSGGRLDLVAQTTWLGDLPAAIDLRVSGAPQDARLAVRIIGPATTRDEVRDSYRRTDDSKDLLAFFEVIDLEAARVGSGDVISVVMPDEEIGILLRRDPGALIVVIDLMSEDVILDTLITHVLVDGPSPNVRRKLSIALVHDLRQPLAAQPDGSIVLDQDSLAASLEFPATRPETPIAMRVNAETIEAIEAIGLLNGGPTIDSVRSLLSTQQLFLEPWVDLDEEAWRAAGEPDTVLGNYDRGRSSTETQLATVSTGIVRLDRDATAETITLLRSTGATGLLVDTDQVRLSPAIGDLHNPVQLLDSNEFAIQTVVTDSTILDTLSGSDSELAAQRAVVELAVEARNLLINGAEIIDITNLDPVALDVLLEGIAASDQLEIVSLEETFDQPFARGSNGAALSARLISDPAPDLTSVAADLQLTRSTLDSYASMVAPAEAPIIPLRQLLEASVSSSLQAEDVELFTSEVFDAISKGTQGITVIEGGRVTLASRTADLPLRIRNDQTLPITVDMFLSSEKLRFPNGDHHTITIAPGDNTFTVTVEAITSGDARVTSTLTSPDGKLELARGNVNIRSTAISGLGLIISLIALAILSTWWIRTILRVRRNRAAASFSRSEGDATEAAADTELGES